MNRTVLSVLAVTAVSLPIPAQERRPVDALPASTLGCLRFAGLESCTAAADRNGLLQLLERTVAGLEPRLRDRATRDLEAEVGRMLRGLDRIGLRPATVRAALAREVVVGFGRPTFFGHEVLPSMLVVFDMRGHPTEAVDLIGALERRAVHAGMTLRDDHVVGDGVRALVNRRGGEILHLMEDGQVMIANSAGYLRESLAALRGGAPRLVDSTAYRVAHGDRQGPPLVEGFVHLAPLMAAARPLLPYEIDGVLRALGVVDVDGLYLAFDAANGQSDDLVRLGVRGPEHGLVRSVLGRPLSFDSVSLCPEDTLLFAAAALDPAAVVASCGRLVASLPAVARRDLERDVGRELRRLDMDAEEVRALAGVFGPEVSIAVTTPAGLLPPPDVVVFVELRDEQAAREIVMGALHRSGLVPVETRYEDTTVYRLRMPRGVRLPLRPALAFADGQLVLASSTQAVRGALLRSSGRADGLDAEPDMPAKLTDTEGASMFCTLRLRQAVGPLWRMAEPFVAMGLEEIGADPDILPTEDELRAVLGDAVGIVKMDQDALVLRQRGPLGPGAALAVFGTLLDRALGATAASTPRSPKRRGRIF